MQKGWSGKYFWGMKKRTTLWTSWTGSRLQTPRYRKTPKRAASGSFLRKKPRKAHAPTSRLQEGDVRREGGRTKKGDLQPMPVIRCSMT